MELKQEIKPEIIFEKDGVKLLDLTIPTCPKCFKSMVKCILHKGFYYCPRCIEIPIFGEKV